MYGFSPIYVKLSRKSYFNQAYEHAKSKKMLLRFSYKYYKRRK